MDAVLFDWDGTLIDSLPSLYRANLAVMESFGLSIDEGRYRQAYTPNWKLMYQRLGLTEDRFEEANERFHAAFAGGHDIELFAGAKAALEAIAGHGIRLGLVTAGGRSVVERQLRRHGVHGLFGATVFGDDLDVQKPHPAPLRRALRILGLDGRPDATAYVGDAPDDMRMARTVGALAVGIHSLIGGADLLVEAGAHVIAPSVAAWVDDLVSGRWQPPTGPLPVHRHVGEGPLDAFARTAEPER